MEKLPCFFVVESLRDGVLSLFLRVFILSIDSLKYFLDGFALLNVFESLHRSHTWNVGSVVASTHDAQVNKLVHGHLEAFKDLIEFNVDDGFFLAVEASQQDLSSKG